MHACAMVICKGASDIHPAWIAVILLAFCCDSSSVHACGHGEKGGKRTQLRMSAQPLCLVFSHAWCLRVASYSCVFVVVAP